MNDIALSISSTREQAMHALQVLFWPLFHQPVTDHRLISSRGREKEQNLIIAPRARLCTIFTTSLVIPVEDFFFFFFLNNTDNKYRTNTLQSTNVHWRTAEDHSEKIYLFFITHTSQAMLSFLWLQDKRTTTKKTVTTADSAKMFVGLIGSNWHLF